MPDHARPKVENPAVGRGGGTGRVSVRGVDGRRGWELGAPRLGRMIRRVDLRGRAAGGDLDYRTLVPRAAFDVEHATDVVRPICDDVRHRGAEAIRAYGEKFDGVAVTGLRVPADALERALDE